MASSEERARRIEPWALILIIGSCVAALIGGYAVCFGTGSHTTALDCIPASGSARNVPSVPRSDGCSVQTPNDATSWWIAAGAVETMTVVAAFGVGASAKRRAQV